VVGSGSAIGSMQTMASTENADRIVESIEQSF
jgi:hypothetical protein